MVATAGFTTFLKEQMAGFASVTSRRLFGGAGLFREGLMFALIVDDILYFKADAENLALFEAENLREFSYETKRGKKGVMSYRRAPERCLDDVEEMTTWCNHAWDAALRVKQAKAL